MPTGGAASRANQKTALAAVIHEKQVDPGLGDLLRQLEAQQKVRARHGRAAAAAAEVAAAVEELRDTVSTCTKDRQPW